MICAVAGAVFSKSHGFAVYEVILQECMQQSDGYHLLMS